MKSSEKFDNFYMKIAKESAQLSHAVRLKVGAVAVRDRNILAFGYNGTPAGSPNECETRVYIEEYSNDERNYWDKEREEWYNLETKDNVLHAEENVICKLASGAQSGVGATLYLTHAPCIKCARMIHSVGFTRLVYHEQYRSDNGLQLLASKDIQIQQMSL